MRSRYSAYALGHVEYIQATTHLDSPHREADALAWAEDLRRFVKNTTFLGLTVTAADGNEIAATVTFEARVRQGGRDGAIREKSRFYRVGGRWLYHSG